MMRRLKAITAAIAGALALSSCASIDVNSLPAPGNSFRDGYDIVMEFESVLNLPGRAKITLDGLVVGMVTGVVVSGSHVDVTSRIDPSVSLPANVHAALQQATVLGDIYIALDPPANGSAGAPLKPGARIPLAQTTSPPQLEDTIAHFADFVGSGSIQRIQNTIMGVNRITPSSSNVRQISTTFATDLGDLSNNIDTVDHLLTGAAQTAAVLKSEEPTIQKWFSEKGMTAFDRAFQVYTYAGKNQPAIGSIYSGGFWLVPFLNSLANGMGAIQQSKWAFESEVPKWRDLFANYFLPQDKHPAVNITSIVGPDGRELSGNVQDVLRILGAMP